MIDEVVNRAFLFGSVPKRARGLREEPLSARKAVDFLLRCQAKGVSRQRRGTEPYEEALALCGLHVRLVLAAYRAVVVPAVLGAAADGNGAAGDEAGGSHGTTESSGDGTMVSGWRVDRATASAGLREFMDRNDRLLSERDGAALAALAALLSRPD